ncbi:uncharacterized protein TEOVI_000146500 [Trypanosoma equiperdum]|uniref:Ubiquinone biosynthesis protein n=1 Tax=Trypanosoma equiperdum TaxID=5694 RepID=A0A1G4ICY2_TRYEQ|nr:hypothetical protein, conserved [Trypanosoma equiperdum]
MAFLLSAWLPTFRTYFSLFSTIAWQVMEGMLLDAVSKSMVAEGAKLVPKYGVRNSALMSLSVNALKGNPTYDKARTLSNRELSRLFPRGFSIAVVEHIVASSNQTAHLRLEECFSKYAILSTVAKNSDTYQLGCYKPPGVREVVSEAMDSKFSALLPYCEHWAEAVALECLPSNTPFAAKLALEFIDTTCYYAERMRSLGSVVEAGNILLQSRISDPFAAEPHSIGVSGGVKKGEKNDAFWQKFATTVPLSSGPHASHGMLGYEWYILRMKVGAILSLGMLSFMGEKSRSRLETKSMVRSIICGIL